MYKAEFDNCIKNSKISNSFIFFGESHFLIDMYTKMLSNIEDSSILTLYYDEYNFTSAKTHLSQPSLFGGINILIVKSDKKIQKKELDTLIDLCEKNQGNIFIFAYYGSDHKTYNNKKTFGSKDVMCVRFFHPKEYESQNILMLIAEEKGVNIDRYSISHLLSIHNGDIALAANEMDKFALLQRQITTKDIQNLVFGLAEMNLEDFIVNILNKQDFRDDLQNLLEHGEDEIRVITTIASYITQLYMFNIYIRVNGNVNAKEILGYMAPKHIVDKKAALCVKLKPKTYYKLQHLLLGSELKMKSSNVDKSAILLSTLIKIQQLLP